MASDLILANMICAAAGERPDLDVLTFVSLRDDGSFEDEVRTYQDLWENGQRVAAGLDGEGLGEGQAFALIMQNHPAFVEAMVGASITNTVFVPIDPRTRGDKLRYMLDFAECRGAIVADYVLANLIDVLPDLAALSWVWVLDTGAGARLPEGVRMQWYQAILSGPVPDLAVRARDPEAPMQMLYTSGTTGDPKAILSPHARFASVAALDGLIGLRPDDRPYTGLSLSHANAQFITLGNVLKMGLRGVFSRKFTKSRLWDIVRHYGCTMFNLLGGMTTAIYAEPRRPDDANNPVRYVLSAGMPAAIWEDFAERFGVEIFEFYGTAEGGLTFNPPGVGPVGSIGKPPPSLICAVLDENDRECAPFEPGEICFRNADGTALKVAYYKNPEASARKVAGGWFRTGDVGHKDAGGWLYFDYRIGGGIRRNGDFINAASVEKVIAEIAEVSDVYVYGVHTEDNAPGEKEVVAAIVAEDRSTFDPQAVFEACRAKLEANAVPGFLQLVDEIPKTASEKPQERFLLARFENGTSEIFTESDSKTDNPCRRST